MLRADDRDPLDEAVDLRAGRARQMAGGVEDAGQFFRPERQARVGGQAREQVVVAPLALRDRDGQRVLLHDLVGDLTSDPCGDRGGQHVRRR